MQRQKVLISLGAIVTPNMQKLIEAYAELISSKNKVEIELVKKQIHGVIASKMEVINQFKKGDMDEPSFNKEMILALKEATQVELTDGEFDTCWHAMHPKYEQFAVALSQAIAYAKTAEVVFISGTNCKDMRNLAEILNEKKIPFKTTNGELSEIDGIPLHSSYIAHLTKQALFTTLIKTLKTGEKKTQLADSMSSYLSTDESNINIPITYISIPSDIKELTLKQDQDKNISDIEKIALQYNVTCLLWDKSKQSLEDVMSTQRSELKNSSNF